MDNLGDLFISNENNVSGYGMLTDLLFNIIDVAVGNIIISDRVLRDLTISTAYNMVTSKKSNAIHTTL